jgi:hypothetical protein
MIGVMKKAIARRHLRHLPRSNRVVGRPDTHRAGRVFGIIVLSLVCGSTALGQFVVQPMRLELQYPPGRVRYAQFTLENYSSTSSQTISLRVSDVTQRPDGVWANIEPGVEITDGPNGERFVEIGTGQNAARVDISELRSCANWVTLLVDTVELAPYARQPMRLKVEVPPGTRGYYCAALLATTLISAGEIEGVESDVMLEFLVPIIIEVQGRPERQKISITDASLEYRRQTPENAAATLVRMDVKNDGGTYSRLNGYARLWGQWGGHWRKLTDIEFPETGIIPGVALQLRDDIGRPLPSGTYKVDGYLFVDGLRGDRISDEFEFEGDPRVTEIAADAALDLDPRDLYIKTLPGATRTGTIAVVNGSEEAVDVEVSAELPKHLYATVLGDVRGEDFGCTEWLEISPKNFRLRGFGRTNIRVVSRMPEAVAPRPNYYSLIQLKATYADGANAGRTRARVVVQNRESSGDPRVEALTVKLAEAQAERYLVTAVFGNFGNTHVMPDCRAVVTLVEDDSLRKQIDMRSEGWNETGIMLPLEKRSFTGVLNVKDMMPGKYRVTALLTHGEGQTVQRQTVVDVSLVGDQRRVEIDPTVPVTKIEL